MRAMSVKLSHGERGLGYGAAAVAALSYLVLWVPNLDRGASPATGAVYLALGLLLAGLVAGAAYSGRRLALAGALLFTGFGPWGPETLFQILYLLAAAALFFRLVQVLGRERAKA